MTLKRKSDPLEYKMIDKLNELEIPSQSSDQDLRIKKTNSLPTFRLKSAKKLKVKRDDVK